MLRDAILSTIPLMNTSQEIVPASALVSARTELPSMVDTV